MELVDRVLSVVGDGEAHLITDVRAETGCGPCDIESMILRGLIRPVGHKLCITPRGVERYLKDKKYVRASSVARSQSFD